MTILSFEDTRMEKLPPKEFGSCLMALPIKKRLDLLLQRPDAEAVVNALADQDFYYSVKELGSEDSLPMLALGTVNQLNHLFDLEWWQKDRILPAQAVDWLEKLSRASERKLLEWVYHADFELLVALFKRWVRVLMTPEDIDLVEAKDSLPTRTLDDQYFWEAYYPQYEDFINQLLSLLFEINYGFYRELMNGVIWMTETEVEEEAYRFHKGRLEDRAIPDFFEALEIYHTIRPEDLGRNKTAIDVDQFQPSAPVFALALVPEGDLLSQAVEGITDNDMLDTIKVELASVANKVVVADGLPPDNTGALLGAVRKTVAYVNLGLSLLTDDNPHAASQIVQDIYLEHLFRLGQSHVARLKACLLNEVQHGWLSRWPKGMSILDEEWLDRAELLLAKTPKIFPETPSHGTLQDTDFFRTKQDLDSAKRIIESILSLGVVFDNLNVSPEKLEEGLWPLGQVNSLEDVTIGILLRTAAANSLSHGTWEVKPIRVEDWSEMFPRLSYSALEEVIRSHLRNTIAGENERGLVEDYLAPLFHAYRTEMGPFVGKDAPDPRMVRFFLFSAR